MYISAELSPMSAFLHCNIAVCSLGKKLGAGSCQRCYGRECNGGNFCVAGTYNKHACIRLTKSATQDILRHRHSVLAKCKLYPSAGRLTEVLQGSIKDEKEVTFNVPPATCKACLLQLLLFTT